MADKYKPQIVPFANKGMVLKLDKGLLQLGQYEYLHNLVSQQEGALVTRHGYRQIDLGWSNSWIHTITRLATGTDPDYNYRYLGEGQDIYRIDSTDSPSPGTEVAELGIDFFGRKWSMVGFRKFVSGTPYAYFATRTLMLADPATDTATGTPPTTLRKWGLDRPIWGISATYNWVAGLSPDEGLEGDYYYVITYRNSRTLHESNPSIETDFRVRIGSGVAGQTDSNAVGLNFRLYFAAPQAPGDTGDLDYVEAQLLDQDGCVRLYRRGGSYSDASYRLVHTWDWDDGIWGGGVGNQYIWQDKVSDSAIASEPVAQWDNDPPVTTAMTTPLTAEIAAIDPLGGDAGIPNWPAVGVNKPAKITITVSQPAEATTLIDILRPGSTVTIGEGGSASSYVGQETVVVWAITDTWQFVCFTQKTHTVGEKVVGNLIANSPCDLSTTAFNSVFLAGDPVNPNFLYKSKAGRPEAWPVVNLNNLAPGSIEVGSPDNHIVAITEFDSQVVCLNRQKIFIVRVWNDHMQAPIETPAHRGLFGRYAWVKTDNEIWYMSYDGIYSWAGGESTKRSEALDPIFKGDTLVLDNDLVIYPVSLDRTENAGNNYINDADSIQMAFHENELLFVYKDAENGDLHQLRYHTLYDRWWYDSKVPTAMNLEEDTGELVFATSITSGGTIAYLNIDKTPPTVSDPYTTDAWETARDDGTPINFVVKTPFYTLGHPTMQKQIGDVVLELSNPADTVTVETFYDFLNEGDSEDIFTIAATGGARTRIPLPLKSAKAQEAYAVAFKITGQVFKPTRLYSLTFHYLVLEEIQRGRAYDWDNLGYPHDKRLTQLTLRYDTGGEDVTLNLDTTSGIEGTTVSLAVQTFTLNSDAATYPPASGATGPVSATVTFPIEDGNIVKMVRVRPTGTTTNFMIWDYKFEFIQCPPDKVLFTPWEDLDYPCEKLMRELVINLDTGGVDATISAQVDGDTVNTLAPTHQRVNTDSNDRARILTFEQDVLAKQIRLVLTPGTSGKCQLYKRHFNWIPEPCKVIQWDSFEQTLGYQGWKFIKQVWVEYLSEVGIIFMIYTDDKQEFHVESLPAHDNREIERFYLPPINSDDVLNKSKTYRLFISSCDPCVPFKLYRDGSRLEWMPVGADQRQGYTQFPYAEYMKMDI